MNERIEQGLHEKLCAYVLGESEGADRAEVERELLRSPELRAERERLENTIGAVREALAPQEVLSADARAALEQAVSPREMRVSPIAQFPWLRLAAGIGAVGLGWWIFAGTPTGRSDVMVASTESARQFGGDKLDSEGENKKAQAALAKDERGQSLRDDKAARLSERVGYSDPAKGQIETSSARSLESMGYSGGTTPTPKNAPAEVMLGQSPAAPTAVGSPVTPSDGLNAAAAPAQAPLLIDRKSGSGARKGRAGGPTKPVQSAPALAQDSLPPPSSAGSYRGAGDSVAPGAGGGPALASTAPSSPGASGPSSGGLATSSDGFLSNRTQVPQEKAEERSRHGFAGDDADAASVALEEDQLIPGRKGSTWQELTSAEQASRIELRAESIYRDCFPRPNERPRDMFFRFWGDNPFEVALLDRLSTFSIDVDTASYTLARRYLNEGKVPEKAQIRTEEFLNYFAADVDAPRNATFAVHSDLTPSRFSADSARQMLRVVVRAKDVEKFERQAMHLTFVVDVSGSMQEQNRLETVKSALRMLVAQLDGRDSIALVKFGTEAQLVLPMTSVLDRVAIEQAITPLVPSGSTNSNAGLQLGYAQALMGLDPNVVNRVVFLSDGVANVGETDAAKILEGVKSIREKGIYLNTIGVGMNNHNDVLLEQLADKGDGMCNYVDSPKEIQRALVDRFTGAFQPIAKDVKIQVEFDPQQVMRYRLLGYENRAIADADFRNDAVDAGEVGAGHQVTALYEIEPTGAAGKGPMATVRLRWKPILPAGTTGVQEATEASFEVSTKSYQAFESAPPGYRRAAIVAQFAEILRRSIHARGESLDDLVQEATKLQAQIPNDADFAEFTTLLLRAKDTILRSLPVCDELCQTVDALRSNIYLGAIFHETGRDPRTLEEIEQNRRELEQRLREVLRREAEAEAGAEKPRVR